MRPADVEDEESERQAFENLYRRVLNIQLPSKFAYQIGDIVNKAKIKGPMAKGMAPTFTTGRYRIASIKEKPPREMYVLQNQRGQTVTPSYYSNQLVLVERPSWQQQQEQSQNVSESE